ncbi:MAG: hypothetical protein NTW86_26585 [Candidatus Sumerlaeota bacterium]|nr:hypothetical protein [Candidatus Sumerlaeota bacterium]
MSLFARALASPWRGRRSPSPVEIVCLVGGVCLVLWYGWLVDDCYVYFRYVDNFVIYHLGLVNNRGEFVEGFSSPLWAVLLIVLRALHLNYWIITLLVGVLSYVGFWALAVLVNRRLAPAAMRPSSALSIPLIYLAFNYGVASYFTSGVESPLVILAAAGYAALAVLPASAPLQILVGLSPMIRHELAVPYVIVLVWLWRRSRRAPVAALASCALTLGPYLLFRIWYYADFFPNTFYLKDVVLAGQGLNYLYDTFMPYFTVPFLAAFALLYRRLRASHSPQDLGREARVVMWGAAAPVILYVVKIGGDPRHLRYLLFPFCLLAFSTAGLAEHAAAGLLDSHRKALAAGCLVLAACVALCFPRQLQQHPIFRSAFGYSHRAFLGVHDAAWHRLNPSVTPPLFGVGASLSYRAARDRYETDNGKTIAYGSWCTEIYLHPKRPNIHSLGLTEPFLARTVMRSDRPAHKVGLAPMAKDIAAIRQTYGFQTGAFKSALKRSPVDWIRSNLSSIELIEDKVFNKHHFLHNFRLALRTMFIKIVPGEPAAPAAGAEPPAPPNAAKGKP